MVILHLSSSYFPRIGGLPGFIRMFARNVPAEHHLVTRDLVRAGTDAVRMPAGTDRTDPAITVHRFYSEGEYLNDEAEGAVRSIPHDLMMIHSTSPPLLKAVRWTRKPVIFCPQCKTRLDMGESLNNVALIVTLTPSAAEHFASGHGYPIDRIRIVPRLVETDLFKWKKRGRLRLLYVGRISPGKRVYELVNLLAVLRSAGGDYTLRIVGDYDHPYRDELPLQTAIRKQGMNEYITFSKALTPDKLAAEYGQGDVFVSASVRETFCQVFLEALASGMAVVSTAEGETREWADEYVSFTTDRDALDELPGLVEWAKPLQNYNEFWRRFSWDANRELWKDTLKEALCLV